MVQSCSQQLIRCLVRCDEQFCVCKRLYVRRARDHARDGRGPGARRRPRARRALHVSRVPRSRPVPETTNSESCPGVSIFGPEATLLPNRSNALRSSSFEDRAPRAPEISLRTSTQLLLKINLKPRNSRLVVESPLIHVEDVFVGCTRFLRMYIHRVSSRLSLDIGHHHAHPPRAKACC